MTGSVFSQLDFPATEYASYAVTITDTTNSTQFTNAGELCPTLAQSGSCTMAETNPSSGYGVTTQFTINPGDAYTFYIVMTSFVSVSASQTTAVQVLADQNDPLSLTLPSGVDFTSQSGQFLAPEPSSWVLVGGGLVLGLGLFRRRMAR
jgi:hypothetical protein